MSPGLFLFHDMREKQNPSLWIPGQARHDKQKQSKIVFIYLIEDKSAFRRANNEITEGLASGGALKRGEHCKALSYEVSRAYKRRFTTV